MQKRIFVLVIMVLSLILAFSGYKIYSYKQDSIKQQEINNKLINRVENNAIKEEKSEQPTYINGILEQYHDLYQENNDLVGWIKIEDTMLNYPIMQNEYDSEYYLRRDFNKDYSIYGTPFLQSGCNIGENESKNLIIYGHNMDDGAGFHTMEYYKDESYYKEHPIIKLDTLSEEREYEIVAVFKTTVYSDKGFKYYKYDDFSSEEHFNEYKQEVKKLALYDTGVDFSYEDNLITLSTCEYSNKNGRLVIVAKLINENKEAF